MYLCFPLRQIFDFLGGENISSIEVEAILLTNSKIDEAAVIAVPDEKWGEVPSAFITLRNNADAAFDGAYVRAFIHAFLFLLAHTQTLIRQDLHINRRLGIPRKDRLSLTHILCV